MKLKICVILLLLLTGISSKAEEKIAIVTNNPAAVDSLLAKGENIVCIFVPEHGFRGNFEAGATINNDVDNKTKLPIISLYGKNKKPKKEQLQGITKIIFDIQDVGVRFYTYISTLHYVMESAAENQIKVVVYDKTNPHCDYVDGPVLEMKNSSFVGMHPVPVIYGMTIGEYALMINGEHWLKDALHCDLEIVKLDNYKRDSIYNLANSPSPNLPNMQSILLYPSLCFFEGSNVSVGRGTDSPFQCFGHPDFIGTSTMSLTSDFVFFTPRPIAGKAENPVCNGKKCYGYDLRNFNVFEERPRRIYLEFLVWAYENSKDKAHFFNSFFIKLAGTAKLQEQIEKGLTADEIRKSWQPDLSNFLEIRGKYLLY